MCFLLQSLRVSEISPNLNTFRLTGILIGVLAESSFIHRVTDRVGKVCPLTINSVHLNFVWPLLQSGSSAGV